LDLNIGWAQWKPTGHEQRIDRLRIGSKTELDLEIDLAFEFYIYVSSNFIHFSFGDDDGKITHGKFTMVHVSKYFDKRFGHLLL
jgi:hypothetical protein